MVNNFKHIFNKVEVNELLNPDELINLENICKTYSYASIFQATLAKAYHQLNSIHFEKQLFKASITASDREKLRSYILSESISKNSMDLNGPYDLEKLYAEETSKKEEIELETNISILTEKQNQDRNLIDRFLAEPNFTPKEEKNLYTPESAAKQSLEEEHIIISETLADVYIKQGKISKAIECFELLSLKFPEKNIYFANRIKKLQENK